jgi:hypothetical protein
MNQINQGPRRQAWERLKRQLDRLRSTIRQFNTDLASVTANNPSCRDLAVLPISEDTLPELPPMPKWEE